MENFLALTQSSVKCAVFLDKTAQYFMFTICVGSSNSNCVPVGNIRPRKVWSNLEMSFVNYPCQCFPGNLSRDNKSPPVVTASLGSHQTHGQLCRTEWKSWENCLLYVASWEVSWFSLQNMLIIINKQVIA